MLLALMLMHLLQIPTVAMLATQLGRHKEYGELCGFNGNNSGRTPDRSTLSKFITRAEPRTVEGVFRELRRQALAMGLYGRGRRVVGAVDSTFIHAYSRRKRKTGVSDRGARVGNGLRGQPTHWDGGFTLWRLGRGFRSATSSNQRT